jgi:hypothetical protein
VTVLFFSRKEHIMANKEQKGNKEKKKKKKVKPKVPPKK